jgi:hypothetical protein
MPGPRTFRKCPVEVQALQWTGDKVGEMQSFADTSFEVLSEPDDWVVRDVQRTFHPVRDDVFREIYEITDC